MFNRYYNITNTTKIDTSGVEKELHDGLDKISESVENINRTVTIPLSTRDQLVKYHDFYVYEIDRKVADVISKFLNTVTKYSAPICSPTTFLLKKAIKLSDVKKLFDDINDIVVGHFSRETDVYDVQITIPVAEFDKLRNYKSKYTSTELFSTINDFDKFQSFIVERLNYNEFNVFPGDEKINEYLRMNGGYMIYDDINKD